MEHNGTTGIIAATAAPFFMAMGFIIWDVTWKASGGSAFALNMFKCNLASVGFLVISFILGWTSTSTSTSQGSNSDGSNVDEEIFSVQSVSFLVLSGFIGIIIGDLAWLEALRLLGATRVLVIDSLKPFTAAIMGWLILNEPINNIAWLGLVLTITGILVVSLERERREGRKDKVIIELNMDDSNGDGEEEDEHVAEERSKLQLDNGDKITNALNMDDSSGDGDEEKDMDKEISKLPVNIHQSPYLGYILAIGNVVLDTYGSILTKQFGRGMSTWAISLIRFGSSGIFMIILSMTLRILHRKKQPTSSESEVENERKRSWYLLPSMDSRAWSKICLGVLFVTFICPALSNYALFQITLALALTLGSITPLYALILEWPFHGKKPNIWAILGVLLAVGGVIILSIWQK